MNKYLCCGECKHFKRIGNQKNGKCDIKEFKQNKYTKCISNEPFRPYQSHKPCINFEKKTTTNRGMIDKFNNDEMANFICFSAKCMICAYNGNEEMCDKPELNCVQGISKWLESEVETK